MGEGGGREGHCYALLTDTSHFSLLTPHSSLLTPHSSLLTPHSTLLTPPMVQASTKESDSNCKARLAAADTACRKQLDTLQARVESEARLEDELGTLRKKLHQKEIIEDAIEARSSKLTQVYKTLESECQQELRLCRDGKGPEAKGGSPPAAGAAAAEAAPPPPSPIPSGHVETLPWASATVRCSQLLLAVVVVGGLGMNVRHVRGLTRRLRSGGASGRRTHVEEMRGWMPTTVLDMNMKLS